MQQCNFNIVTTPLQRSQIILKRKRNRLIMCNDVCVVFLHTQWQALHMFMNHLCQNKNMSIKQNNSKHTGATIKCYSWPWGRHPDLGERCHSGRCMLQQTQLQVIWSSCILLVSGTVENSWKDHSVDDWFGWFFNLRNQIVALTNRNSQAEIMQRSPHILSQDGVHSSDAAPSDSVPGDEERREEPTRQQQVLQDISQSLPRYTSNS